MFGQPNTPRYCFISTGQLKCTKGGTSAYGSSKGDALTPAVLSWEWVQLTPRLTRGFGPYDRFREGSFLWLFVDITKAFDLIVKISKHPAVLQIWLGWAASKWISHLEWSVEGAVVDMVPHAQMCAKLESRVNPAILRGFDGVPQGAVLQPLLYVTSSLYFNHVYSHKHELQRLPLRHSSDGNNFPW